MADRFNFRSDNYLQLPSTSSSEEDSHARLMKTMDDGFEKILKLLDALIDGKKGNEVTSKGDSVLHKTAHDDENGGTEETEIKMEQTTEYLGGANSGAKNDDKDLVEGVHVPSITSPCLVDIELSSFTKHNIAFDMSRSMSDSDVHDDNKMMLDGNIQPGCQVFDKITKRDGIACITETNDYYKVDLQREVCDGFRDMQQLNLELNEVKGVDSVLECITRRMLELYLRGANSTGLYKADGSRLSWRKFGTSVGMGVCTIWDYSCV